jgi:hypothetical protein
MDEIVKMVKMPKVEERVKGLAETRARRCFLAITTSASDDQRAIEAFRASGLFAIITRKMYNIIHLNQILLSLPCVHSISFQCRAVPIKTAIGQNSIFAVPRSLIVRLPMSIAVM